jgi:hypothetical protein
MSYEELTPREHDVVDILPGNSIVLADELGISKSRVRALISSISDKIGIDREYTDNNNAVYGLSTTEEEIETGTDEGQKGATETDPTPTRLPASAKASVTRDAKQWAAEMESYCNALLADTEPAVADVRTPTGGEDVVIPRFDDHIGKVVRNEHGDLLTDSDLTASTIDEVCQTAFDHAEYHANGGVDTLWLVLGGDTVTGEGIYQNQMFDNDLELLDQVELAIDVYFRQIQDAASRFPHVAVACQSGNHGEVRAQGIDDGFNCDTIVYRMLDSLVRTKGLDNISFYHNAATKYLNVTFRPETERWECHIRHGQDSLAHIGTSSGKNRWRGWKLQHEFDMAFRGHYHELKVEEVYGSPVVMSGSICPPDDFEESLSEWSRPAGTVLGVSDDQPISWMSPIYI